MGQSYIIGFSIKSMSIYPWNIINHKFVKLWSYKKEKRKQLSKQ